MVVVEPCSELVLKAVTPLIWLREGVPEGVTWDVNVDVTVLDKHAFSSAEGRGIQCGHGYLPDWLLHQDNKPLSRPISFPCLHNSDLFS